MIIRSQNGTEYDTVDVPDKYDIAYCAECGCRICWYDTSMHDAQILHCEDCIAGETNEPGDS